MLKYTADFLRRKLTLKLFLTVILPIIVTVAILGAGWYFTRKKLKAQQAEQARMVKQYKQTISVFVIEKKMGKISDGKFPKEVLAEVPKYLRWRKMPLVKVKAGPQIISLTCDKKVYERLPINKTIKADIAGIYLASFRQK